MNSAKPVRMSPAARGRHPGASHFRENTGEEFQREHPTFVKTLVKNSKPLMLPLSKMVYLQKWDAPLSIGIK